ncbi:ragulator complex protein LAMTOR3 isoform X2 [Manis javanica]|uniref:ragulator complex protein LAMTOR3 isoform X2 n=1 Tax=Manis javanica TaxID=9974 RepID=UPI0018793821|nr:ragulator complex protein LAMTOR3 isoform X2 [Manis javanica]
MYQRVVGTRTVKLVFWKAQISKEFICNSANSTEPFEPWLHRELSGEHLQPRHQCYFYTPQVFSITSVENHCNYDFREEEEDCYWRCVELCRIEMRDQHTIWETNDLKRFLYKKLPSVEGLHAIVVSDRDGVPVIKVANDNAPEHALRPGFLSTFALATDQGSKLGLSKNKSIICYYNTYQD